MGSSIWCTAPAGGWARLASSILCQWYITIRHYRTLQYQASVKAMTIVPLRKNGAPHANDIRRPVRTAEKQHKKRPARRLTRPFVKSARRIVAQARLAESGRRRTGGPGVESGHHLRNKRDRRRRRRAQSCLSRRGDAAKSRRKLGICNGESANCLDQREKEPVLCRTSRHGAHCINKALCLGNAIACAGREARNGTRRRCCLCICERNGSAKRQSRNQQRPFKHNEPLKWIVLGKSARKIKYILY